jgi:PII-like signaling protein
LGFRGFPEEDSPGSAGAVAGEAAVRTEDEGKLLRIFVDEGARYEGKSLYEAVVERCLAEGMAGATVVRGIQGYGADMTIRSAGVLRLSADLPVVVEVADGPERIDRLLPALEAMIGKGLITVERVRMIRLTPDPTDD